MARANLSPALHTELSEQLEKQLDEADELDSLRKAVGSAFADELKRIRLAVARTRRQLKGQDLPQREIPGAERAQVKRDPFLQRLMAAARELLEYREEQEEEKDEKPPREPKKGLTAVTLHTAGGSVTATPAQLRAGLDELERRKGATPGARALTWHDEDDGRVLGVATDGLVYSIETSPSGWRWSQGKKRGRLFAGAEGNKSGPQLAKEDAERAELERQADARLPADLKRADLKGPAAARKKGGRRG